MEHRQHQNITVADLTGVVYSSGRVFNDLSTGRLDTEEFLRSGSLTGVNSKSDLALLEDLRDVSQLIIDHGQSGGGIDVSFVRRVNATMTRSGALRPGQFRRDDQGIGVNTRFGRHAPAASSNADLQQLLDRALRPEDPREQALNLFVAIAKAQPFEDGNKRTAIFVANGLLIRERAQELLTVPIDGAEGIEQGRSFNDLLARSYIFGEDTGVKNLMREHGFGPLPGHEVPRHQVRPPSPMQRHRVDLADRVAEIDRNAGRRLGNGYER